MTRITSELEIVREALEEQGFILFEGKAHYDLGENEITDLVRRFKEEHGLKKDNRVLLFYSGHGETVDDEGYVVPVDAPGKDAGEQFFARAISMRQFKTWAEDFRTNHLLFCFDCCFSGTIVSLKGSVTPSVVIAATAKRARQFLTAGGAGEPVPARSVFAPEFARGIRGEADLVIDGKRDGVVTGSELAVYLRETVAQATSKSNTPQFGKLPGFHEGDFVFVPPPSRRRVDRR